MGIKTVPQPPYRPDLAPCDFWSFPKLRGCRYETIEEMKEAVTKVINTLTQEDFDGAFQKLLERYNKCIAAGGDYFEGDWSFMCAYDKFTMCAYDKCTINRSAHTEKVWKLIVCTSYIHIYLSSSSPAESREFPDTRSIHSYYLFLLVSPLDCIQCPHSADVFKSLLARQH